MKDTEDSFFSSLSLKSIKVVVYLSSRKNSLFEGY